jgi:uncharacterized membrane protein
MAKSYLKQDKGMAGLEILLSVVVMIFVIGFLVMIFAMMSGEIATATYTTTTISFTNKTTSSTAGNSTGTYVGTYTPTNYRDCSLTITQVRNTTGVGYIISSGNYTISGCLINGSTAAPVGVTNVSWNVTGSITYNADNTATNVINETADNISGVTDWFGIIIVITAMVVLILLTVIIISAIKGSGMLGIQSKAPTESA